MSKVTVTFACETCANGKKIPKKDLMTGEQVKAHLKEKHGIDEPKGRKQMSMAIDGEGFGEMLFEWDIGGVKLTQSVYTKKSKRDFYA